MANRIVYEDYAVGAAENAVIDLQNTDQQLKRDGQQYTDPYHVDKILEDDVNEHASFDGNGIDLTKPFRVFGNSNLSYPEGFVSADVSGSDCTFTTPQKITITFGNAVISGNGISVFYNTNYCKTVRVTYTHSNESTSVFTYYNNLEKEVFLPARVDLYKKIEIEFLDTEVPNQRAKVRRITFGREVIIDKMKSISFNKKMDYYGADIPINSLDVTFYNEEELNMSGNQKIRLYHNDDLIGTYWIADVEKVTDKLYSVSADDAFCILDNVQADPIWVRTGTSKSFSEITSAIHSSVSITGHINGSAGGMLHKVSGRRLLAESIFAFKVYAKTTADGNVLVFYPITSDAFNIGEDKIIGTSKFSTVKAPTSVLWTYTKYGSPMYGEYIEGQLRLRGIAIDSAGATVTEQYPIYTLFAYDSSNEPVPSQSYSLTSSVPPLSVTMTPTGSTLSNINVYMVYYNRDEVSVKKERENVGTNERVDEKDFGQKGLYNILDLLWADDVKNRVFGVIGEVRAKIILNHVVTENNALVTKYLDVGDYVSIDTKYSGKLYGTITEINANVGYEDIVGDVVITVWQTNQH